MARRRRRNSRFDSEPGQHGPYSRLSSNAGNPVEREIRERTRAFGRVFTKVASAIANRRVPVIFGDTAYQTAHTDGETITLDSTRFAAAMRDAVANRSFSKLAGSLGGSKGLLYHELAHVLFSPRVTQRPTKEVASQRNHGNVTPFEAFNILEDQRIERLFIASWPSAATAYRAMVSQFMLARRTANSTCDTPSITSDQHMLLHGRRYFDAEARALARRLFVETHGLTMAANVAQVIDEYVTLNFPKDADRALELIKQFASILEQLRANDARRVDGLDNHSAQTKGRSDKSRQKAASKAADAADAADNDGGKAADALNIDGDDAEASDCSDSGDGVSGGEADGSDADKDAATMTGNTSEGGNDSQAGTGDRDTDRDDTADELADYLEKSLSRIADDAMGELMEESLSDIEAASHEYTRAASGMMPVDDQAFVDNSSYDPDHQTQATYRELSEAFAALLGAAEPTWVARQSMGRLNIPALMESQGVDLDVFDQWDNSGEDAGSIEVVLLCDASSSMITGGLRKSMSSGLWAIASACADYDIPLTVIGYSNYGFGILNPGDRVPARPKLLYAGGGTNPVTALEAAYLLLSRSEAHHRLLFTITDGEWGSISGRNNTTDRAHPIVRQINELGVDTFLLYLSPRGDLREGTADEFFVDTHGWHAHAHGFIGTPRQAAKLIAAELEKTVREGLLYQ